MIESDLSRIATALELIAAALSAKPIKDVKDTPVAVQAPVPTPVIAPVVAPVVAAPVMPAAPFPVVAPVVAAPAPVVAPVVAAPVATGPAVFASKEEMTQFVINSYRALGAEKGVLIQGVLTAMGYANINDVDPARWGELKTGVEALAK